MENDDVPMLPPAKPRLTITELNRLADDLDSLYKQTYKATQHKIQDDRFYNAMRLVYLNQCAILKANSAILRNIAQIKEDFGEV